MEITDTELLEQIKENNEEALEKIIESGYKWSFI